MGKYWYKDHENKWRQGDDNDDLAVAIIIAIAFSAIWIVWKPIKWWLLKKEEPTTGKITLWVIAAVLVLAFVIYLSVS